MYLQQNKALMKIIQKILLSLFVLSISQIMIAQTILTGKVTDINSEPLLGANVYVLNQNNRSLAGCMVGENGGYRIQIPAQTNLRIVFSFIGYKTQIIDYSNQTTINVKLEEESKVLETVDISAKRVSKNDLGLTSRDQVTATQTLSLQRIETAPVTSVTEALQGALSNVDILTGADPGSKATIRIRGTSSLNASSDPLIVVDGVPFPVDVSSDFNFATANSDDYGTLLNISPNDLESVEVLKDAAATAVWGSRGANGVLLFKTKKGAKGKIKFSFSSKYEFMKEANTIPLLSGSQYRDLMQDAIWNTVNQNGYNNQLDNLTLLFNQQLVNTDKTWIYNNEYNQNTNWVDAVTQTGYSADNNFSMSGGGEKANYRLSLGYLSENGTTIGTGYKRVSAMFNMQYKFSDKLDISTDFSFSRGGKDASWDDSPRGEALIRMPNMSPYTFDDNGNRTNEYFTPNSYFQGTFSYSDSKKAIDGRYNPVAMVYEAKNKTISYSNRLVFNLHYELFKGLDYYGLAGLDIRTNDTKKYLPQSVTGVEYINEWYNRSSTGSSDNLALNTENKLILNENFNENNKLIVAAIVQTTEQVNSAYLSEISGNASSSTSGSTTSGNIQAMGSGRSSTTSFGSILNAHYTLFNKYMFSAGYRMEANSNMGSDRRWGGFPTLGVAWQLGDENFIKKYSWISNAKLRLSWGQSGNAPGGTSPYIGIFQPTTPGYIDMNAIAPVSIQLDHLKWETVTQSNFGFDLALFENKLSATVDVYYKLTTDLLQKDVKTPTSTGFTKVKYYNSGEMSNKGWEFRIDWDVIAKKDFGIQLNFNIAQNINEIISLPSNLLDNSYTFDNQNYASKVVSGDPLGSFYGYKCLGVYQNTEETYAKDLTGSIIRDISGEPVVMSNGGAKVYAGDAKYKDVNGDGIINQYDIMYLGNAMPTMTGGFGFNIRYKNLGLIATFQARQGQKIVNQVRMNMENMHSTNNQSTAVLKRWRSEGDNTNIPRALYGIGYNYLGSDRFVEDGSFLRMKTITLKYILPKLFTAKAGISRMEVYITAYDLWTLTGYTGQDPEVNLSTSVYMLAKDNAITPKPIRVAAGFSLNF
jgi:TonB-linked SusC/RagA family outer membrane protein